MRWLADELNEADIDSTLPYKEGNVYICRNCACDITRRQSLCSLCRKAKRREQYDTRCRMERRDQQLMEEESRG